MNCPRCGAENPAGEAACWKCYTPLTGEALEIVEEHLKEEHDAEAEHNHELEFTAPSEEPVEEMPLRPRRLGFWKVFLWGVVLVLLAFGLWVFLYNYDVRDAEDFVLSYLQALQMGMIVKPDEENMARFITAKDEEAMKNSKDFTDRWISFGPQKQIEKWAEDTGKEVKITQVNCIYKGRKTARVEALVPPEVQSADVEAAKILPAVIPFILAKDAGKWKIDMPATMEAIAAQKPAPKPAE